MSLNRLTLRVLERWRIVVALTEALANPSRPVKRLLEMAASWAEECVDDPPSSATYRTAHQLRPHEVDELVSLFDPSAGMGVKELAAKFGLHRSTVGKHLKARGIDTRPRFNRKTYQQPPRSTGQA